MDLGQEKYLSPDENECEIICEKSTKYKQSIF
jgi:hypothetical protein